MLRGVSGVNRIGVIFALRRLLMLNYLGKTVSVVMDRPLGSRHPEYELIYPVNYGYIENTVSEDGEEIDAYILGEFEPLDKFTGVVIAVITRSDDVESKLVVSSKQNRYSKEQIESLVEFQERFFNSEIITFDFLRPSIRNTVKALIMEMCCYIKNCAIIKKLDR